MTDFSHYLEAESVSGGKYWDAEVDGNDFKVRFGKLGQAKDWTVKTFDSNEDALKEANKKLKAKLKKGYAAADRPTGE